jgi:hypothetical protein
MIEILAAMVEILRVDINADALFLMFDDHENMLKINKFSQ